MSFLYEYLNIKQFAFRYVGWLVCVQEKVYNNSFPIIKFLTEGTQNLHWTLHVNEIEECVAYVLGD